MKMGRMYPHKYIIKRWTWWHWCIIRGGETTISFEDEEEEEWLENNDDDDDGDNVEKSLKISGGGTNAPNVCPYSESA